MKICVFGQQDGNQVRMSLKVNAVEVKGFPFMPVSGRKNLGNGGNLRLSSIDEGSDHNPAWLKAVLVVIVNYLYFVFLDPVDSGNGLKKKTGFIHYPGAINYLIRVAENINVGAPGSMIGKQNPVFPRPLFFRFFLGSGLGLGFGSFFLSSALLRLCSGIRSQIHGLHFCGCSINFSLNGGGGLCRFSLRFCSCPGLGISCGLLRKQI